MLPDAEDFVQQAEYELLLVLGVQLAVHLVRAFRVGSVEVRYSRRWHPKLDLGKLVDVNACHDRVLVILQAALKRHEFKL